MQSLLAHREKHCYLRALLHFTDYVLPPGLFARSAVLSKELYFRLAKTYHIARTPFESTLYLDADKLKQDNLSSILQVMGQG